jgi:prolipoprotein diacylglyceryltransferase
MKALRVSIAVAGRTVSTFQLCGVAGFLAAIAVALVLGLHLGLSVGWLAVLSAAAVLSFIGLAVGTWLGTGVERLVFYRHEILVLAIVGAASAVSGRHPLPYLDVAAVALGVFLAVGRIGCTMVGCCHGRPARRGLRYGDEHAAAGFSSWLVGVPLFPVQPAESAAVALLTATAGVLLWRGTVPPGAVLARQLASYALLRFVLELARGDVERPSWLGLSEGQWTALGMGMAVAIAERTGLLPPSAWHGAGAGALAGAAVVVILRHRSARMLSPAHVAEIARAVRAAPLAPAKVHVATTSLGLRLSASVFPKGPEGRAHLCTMSGVDGRKARTVARLLRLLCARPGGGARSVLVETRPGLFHLIVTSERGGR